MSLLKFCHLWKNWKDLAIKGPHTCLTLSPEEGCECLMVISRAFFRGGMEAPTTPNHFHIQFALLLFSNGDFHFSISIFIYCSQLRMFLIACISLYSLSPTSIHVLVEYPSCCVKLCDLVLLKMSTR